MRVLGMISGTSFDAVDIAVADLVMDGDQVHMRPNGELSVPIPDVLRRGIAEALPPRLTSAKAICQLDTRLGQLFASAAEQGIHELGAGICDLVVSHGQTIYHWVNRNQAYGTLQLGQPSWIAARTGCSVIADLRARDVAHGGHGAPLASTLDVLLLGRDDMHPRAALNLGGIANLTVVGGNGAPIAFDTGPANGLLDVAIEELTEGFEAFDQDGRRAGEGQVDVGLLAALLDDPYYELEPPKSTG
jgi:anhydro-N-acetylmuramic acid kinase